MTRKRQRAPRLTEEKLEDHDALMAAIGQVCLDDAEFGRMSTHIQRLQKTLRRQIDRDAWSAYLRIEEVTNQRFAATCLGLVHWAFSEGRREGFRDAAARRLRRGLKP